ncbi:Replication factor C, subunit RFC4 [Cryptotrichosporon argae]
MSHGQKASSQSEYMDEVVAAAFKGLGVGAAVYAPAHYVLTRRSAFYRALPLPAKAFGALMTTVPIATVFAEKAGEHYIARTQWTGVGRQELDKEAEEARKRWERLSSAEKLGVWASNHQYGIIGGSWAGSLAIAWGIVARNPYQTISQKIVQARMWAQGLTVGVLIVSAVLAGVNSKGQKPKQPEDHSWEDILESEGKLSHADRVQLDRAVKAEQARRAEARQ